MNQQQRTVLIVDDSAEDRELYKRYLLFDRDYSYTILEAELAEQGLTLWHQHQPDIVLLDYQLPDLDGLELISRFSTQQPFFAVIVITGQGNEEIAVRAIKAGAQNYLVKGQISPENLQLAVNGAIEGVKLRKELQQRIDRERLIAQISQQIHQSLNFAEILQTTVTEVRQFLQTDRVLVFRLLPDGNGTVVAESVKEDWLPLLSSNIYDPCLSEDNLRSDRVKSEIVTYDSRFNENYVARYRQGWVTAKSDIYDGSIDPCHVELLARYQVRANLVVPILQNNQLWGLLIVHHCLAPRQWQSLEIDLLKELSTHMAIALQHAELARQTRQQLTERQKTQETLRQSEEHLRLGMQVAGFALARFDYRSNMVELSPEAAILYGLPTEELVVPRERIHATFHPEDRDELERIIQQVLDPTSPGWFACDHRVVWSNGAVRWLSVRKQVFFDRSGELPTPSHAILVALDITERKRIEIELKESEERFRELAENIDAVFWMKKVPENQVLYISPAYKRLWGLNPQEIYEGKQTWENYVYSEDRQWSEKAFREKAATGQFDEEYRIVLPDGSLRWVRDRCFPLKNEVGEIYRFTGIAEDITSRKQTHETLRQSEELKQRILESSSDCIKLLDLDGGLLYMNAGGMCLMEIDSLDPYLGQKWICFWQQELRERVELAIAKAKAGELGKFQGYCSTAKGTPKFWDVVVAPVMDATGEVIQLLATSRDVTEQKQTELNLQESEERFRTLADNMSQFAWMADENGSLFWYNQRWFEYTGTTLEEMQGWGWQKIHHPEHVDRVVAHFRNCLVVGESWEDTFPLLGKDGKYRWFLSRAIPIRDRQGKIVRWFGTNTDIQRLRETELDLRESEERYRSLAELIPQLVWTADEEGAILDINQRWFNFTGLTLDRLQTLGWEAVIHPADLPILRQQWATALQSGMYYQAECRMRRVDGIYRWHLHQATPQKNERGQIVKWFGTATDIEEQKQLDIERIRVLELEQTARAEAERANRIKDEFLAILSHELRSPLNPILGWVQLLQTKKIDPTRTAHGLATIERNVKLQTQLIDDLLDVAKILRGKLSLKVLPIDLALVIAGSLDTVRTAATAKSISIQPILAKIPQVSGDPTRLQQIIWNLLSNAIKFTPNGGRVEIRLERVNNLAQITVSDTGKGIDPEFLPHIFEYFRQEDASITRKHGGLGLGLAIVRHLVEAHGGTIAAFSLGKDRGATFTLRLPLLNVELETEQPQDLLDSDSDLTGIRVLCIDDEPDTLELLEILLTEYGASVMTVTCAAELLTAIESFQPDILVSDIGMPEVDGYTLLQQVRSLPPEKGGQIPAIALTAYAGELDRQRALSVGFQRHFAKPIEPNHLTQAILSLVSNRPNTESK